MLNQCVTVSLKRGRGIIYASQTEKEPNRKKTIKYCTTVFIPSEYGIYCKLVEEGNPCYSL